MSPQPRMSDPRVVVEDPRAFEAETRDHEVRLLRRALQDQLHVSQLLERAVEGLADGVVTMDHRGSVTHVSGLPRRAGATPDFMETHLPEAVVRRLRRERAGSPGDPVFTVEWEHEAETRTYEVRAIGNAAEIVPAAADRPGREGDTNVLEGITIFAFRDRTHERRHECELERARELAELGRMLATVAHEIRNPLGAIQGFAHLLQQDLDGDSPSRTHVDRILRGVDRASRLVGELLAFSRPIELCLEPVSLDALVAESMTSLRSSPRWSSRIELDLALDPGLPPCRADRRKVLQVLDNLYNNAIDAMDGEGTLTVRVRETEGIGGASGQVRIVVRDTGCGMNSEELTRIFEPFYTSKAGGTGLGLALVRRVIETHGGTVHVVSAPGRGTSFVIDLPTAVISLDADEIHKEAA